MVHTATMSMQEHKLMPEHVVIVKFVANRVVQEERDRQFLQRHAFEACVRCDALRLKDCEDVGACPMWYLPGAFCI